MGDLPGGGGAAELASHTTSFQEPNPLEIGQINWAAADKVGREIIRKVGPTSVSEEKRKEVVDYIQRLIRNCLGAEVFPYGSVPLKTYLPDGDIDLTTFGGANIEDSLADEIKFVLEEEERNPAADFVVKDVQVIHAEVKLIKCIVQDIVVDISINQIGGLCTLCFLEQVDRLIGKDHLFKRSIILIKAWCYYESRILGAHHGLISTYALETLVLYIFHLYHSTLHGPLAVLYKFLDYFSKFDWETYCISLNGPIRISSLPCIAAEMPEDSDKDLLLSRDFLSSCVGMFSVPSRTADRNSRGLQLKNLNIIDPLKESNNLGRSVSKGNYYRIRSAFSYGARNLARILAQPQDSIANELHRFFANTIARHGGGRRLPNVQDSDQNSSPNESVRVHFKPHLYCRVKEENPDSDNLVRCEKEPSDVDSGEGRNGTPESISSSDLTGDYESYSQHLHYGRWCYENGLGMHSLPMPPLAYRSNIPWDSLPHMPHFKQNGFRHNGFHPSPPVYAMQPVLLPAVTYGWEDMPKPRGTGTYFPNTNLPVQNHRGSATRGRNQGPTRSPRTNGRNTVFMEPSSHEPSQAQVHIDNTMMVSSSDSHLPFFPHLSANGMRIPPEGDVEFVQDNNRPQRPVPSSPSTMQTPQSALSKEPDRISLGSAYRLKDEDDFPPLSS